MMIKVIAVGKLKEVFWKQAINEYEKRLSNWLSIHVIEIKEETTNDTEKNIEKEGHAILSFVDPTDYIITLEINGKNLDSEKIASLLEEQITYGVGNIVFIIGGSDGLNSLVSKRSNFALSFGKQTYPHQMVRVILFEQLYRSFSIINHQKYHK